MKMKLDCNFCAQILSHAHNFAAYAVYENEHLKNAVKNRHRNERSFVAEYFACVPRGTVMGCAFECTSLGTDLLLEIENALCSFVGTT